MGHSSNWRGINSISLNTERRLQVLNSKKERVPLKILYHRKWPTEIMMILLKRMAASAPFKLQYALNRNVCQIHCLYTTHCSIKEWMAATNLVK